ncbi:MAG: mannose-1-phosphate guanylyltransferase [Clostridiaceae bacterium]
MISVVIMAGGRGERFWPQSRRKLPKQLLSLTGNSKTMIQLTVDRVKSLVDYENIYIVTNNEFSNIISDQLPEIPTENILIEPLSKNTAPCIGLAAIHIAKKNRDSTMIILPSDHLIQDKKEFENILKAGTEVAGRGDNLVTIGITPTYPEIGYGYIKFDTLKEQVNGCFVNKVHRFIEKPDIEKAEHYIKTGEYLWNSGMFICKVSTILICFKKYMPSLYQGLMKIEKAIGEVNEEEILIREFEKFENISIDYGIMERAEDVYIIPGNFGWDDVGSWTSLQRIQGTDEDGNTIGGNIVSVDTKDCILQGKGKLIATVGIENLIVIDTEDATLICSKDKCHDIKKLLTEIRNNRKENYL